MFSDAVQENALLFQRTAALHIAGPVLDGAKFQHSGWVRIGY
jgi:hypothetical protein